MSTWDGYSCSLNFIYNSKIGDRIGIKTGAIKFA